MTGRPGEREGTPEFGLPEDLRRGFKGKWLTWQGILATRVRGWGCGREKGDDPNRALASRQTCGHLVPNPAGTSGKHIQTSNTCGQHTPLSCPLQREGPGAFLYQLLRVTGRELLPQGGSLRHGQKHRVALQGFGRCSQTQSAGSRHTRSSERYGRDTKHAA